LEGIQQKFLVTASKYWRQGRRAVNVGHRGLGKNIGRTKEKKQTNPSFC
jgi:hypothetical protein